LTDVETGYTSASARRIRAGPFIRRNRMAALIALVLILAIFGGLGFAAHVLWYVLIIAVLLWLIGFFVGGVADGGGRRWYGR
jgi:energy-coupling factor transporter transmembrane protein EcfT